MQTMGRDRVAVLRHGLLYCGWTVPSAPRLRRLLTGFAGLGLLPLNSPPLASQHLSRLGWQCRRGMRELDDLLTRYLDDGYGAADADEKAAFEALLALPDPELVGYLLNRQQPVSGAIANVVKHILGRNSGG